MCKLNHILSSPGETAIEKSPTVNSLVKKKKNEAFRKQIITASLSLDAKSLVFYYLLSGQIL